MSDYVLVALLWAFVGFQWGGWWQERKAKRTTEKDSAAFKLLYGMVTAILEKRKFVGRGATISRVERFEITGEKFTLELKSEGDQTALEDIAA